MGFLFCSSSSSGIIMLKLLMTGKIPRPFFHYPRPRRILGTRMRGKLNRREKRLGYKFSFWRVFDISNERAGMFLVFSGFWTLIVSFCLVSQAFQCHNHQKNGPETHISLFPILPPHTMILRLDTAKLLAEFTVFLC